MTGRRISLKIGVLLVAMTQVALAADNSNGCGMGWKIAPRNSLISSSTRSYVNMTFSNTSGMTSGTSGCAKHSIVQNEMKAVHYAEANYGQLMVEMAQGSGEHLDGLAMTLGCGAGGTASFGQSAQENYPNIFPSSNGTPGQMLEGVRGMIHSSPSLQQQCGLTG